MKEQPDLLGGPTKRYRDRAEIVRMSLRDAGAFPDGRAAVHFVCETCELDQGWTYQHETDAAVMAGRPCPRCNKGFAI